MARCSGDNHGGSLKPGPLDLYITKGASLDELFTWYEDEAQTEPVDLSGWTAQADFREYPEQANPSQLVLATGGAATKRIVLGGAAGTIQLEASPTNVNAITFRRGVWALELVEPSGKVWPLLSGKVTISPEIVR